MEIILLKSITIFIILVLLINTIKRYKKIPVKKTNGKILSKRTESFKGMNGRRLESKFICVLTCNNEVIELQVFPLISSPDFDEISKGDEGTITFKGNILRKFIIIENCKNRTSEYN